MARKASLPFTRSYRKSFQSCIIEYNVSCGPLIYDPYFIRLRSFLSVPGLLSVYHEGYWILSDGFQYQLRGSYDFCPSFCLGGMSISWVLCFDPSLHSRYKFNLVMVYNPFNVLFEFFCWCLLRILYQYSSVIFVCRAFCFFLLVGSLSGFWY